MQRITTGLALAAVLLLVSLETASAQRKSSVNRASFNQGGPGVRYAGGDTFSGDCASGNCGPVASPIASPPIGDEPYIGEPDGFGGDIAYDSACEDGFFADEYGTEPCGLFGANMISVGVEFTFLKPHFENNVAFTTLQSDGATFDNFSTTEFDYNSDLSPRVWLEVLQMGSLGLRATYWQFDESAADLTTSPDANGFGRIDPPSFADIDLSTTTPGSMYTAASALNAYTIDFEGTKSFDCGLWGWMASAGLRFAEAEQSYNGTLVNATGADQGNVSFSHIVQGIGPTVSVRTQRPFTSQLSLFGFARGALLFGDGKSTLNAAEDLDLDTQFNTQVLSDRNDVLPMAEVQVGLQWTPPACGVWFPYLHVAMEGQLWGGAGDASSEMGNLGFYGFNTALGMDW